MTEVCQSREQARLYEVAFKLILVFIYEFLVNRNQNSGFTYSKNYFYCVDVRKFHLFTTVARRRIVYCLTHYISK